MLGSEVGIASWVWLGGAAHGQGTESWLHSDGFMELVKPELKMIQMTPAFLQTLIDDRFEISSGTGGDIFCC